MCLNQFYSRQTHIIKNTLMKQNKLFNGDLTPEHKNYRTTMSPTTDIDSRRQPSETNEGVGRLLV